MGRGGGQRRSHARVTCYNTINNNMTQCCLVIATSSHPRLRVMVEVVTSEHLRHVNSRRQSVILMFTVFCFFIDVNNYIGDEAVASARQLSAIHPALCFVMS